MASPYQFTFDTTIAGTESTSYAPLASDVVTYNGTTFNVPGANDYLQYHYKSDVWNNLTDTEKQRYLITATTRLDMETYAGVKTTNEQNLQFPRSFVPSRDSNRARENYDIPYTGEPFYNSDTIPKEIIYATIELAVFYADEWLEENPLFSRQDQERFDSIKLGPITASIRKGREDDLPDRVKRLLVSLGQGAWLSGGGSLEGYR